jgi:hypothetical protein
VSLPRAAVRGAGLWRPAPGAETPPPRLPPRLRRRASLLINMVAEVAAQAAEEAGVSLATVPLVVGSGFGEIGTALEIFRDLEGEGLVSPASFQSSVHNSAAAHLSIAHGNRTASTSIAAGDETVPMVLLEALTLLAGRGGHVLAIVADEALPAELGAAASEAVAAALLLEAPAPARAALAILDDLRPIAAAAPAAPTTVPCAPGARLVEAIRAGRVGQIELGTTWSVALRRGEGA